VFIVQNKLECLRWAMFCKLI